MRGVRSAGESTRANKTNESSASQTTTSESLQLDIEAQPGRRSSFPIPLQSSEPSVSRTQRVSSRQSDQVERRVQSGPKERASSRSSEAGGIKKYGSMGSIDNKDAESVENRPISASRNSRARIGKAKPSLAGGSEMSDVNRSSGGRDMGTSDADNSPVGRDLGTSDVRRTSSAKDSGNFSERSSTPSVDEPSGIKQRSGSLRSSSSASEAGDNEDQNALFKENIDPLLKQMELNYLHSDFPALCVNFDMLWKTLEFCNLLGKGSSSGSARKRTIVLRTVFKFVDADSAEVILKLCKLALAVSQI